MRLVQDVFLTCLPRKEYHMLIFLRKGFRAGPSITEMLADETVHRLNAAVRYLYNENHLTLEFLRFSDFKGNLAAEIAPNNFVLPLLGQHFCERYPEERFLIYDRTHGAALVYQPYEARIMPVEHFELPGPDAEEQKYRELCSGMDCDFEEKDAYVYALEEQRKLEQELSAMERLGFHVKKSPLSGGDRLCCSVSRALCIYCSAAVGRFLGG